MLKLRGYQENAVDFIYEHDRAMVLASVGAGKTAIALTAMAEMIDAGIVKRWLVLAPKRVCTDVWPQECCLWAPELTMGVATGSPQNRKDELEYLRSQLVVTNYDSIQSITSLASFDGIVFDELTRLKNPSGARFKHLLKLIEHINIRVGLTGSFTSNGLEDVFGQVKIVDVNLLGKTKSGFLKKFFIPINPQFGEWMPRKGALEDIMATIKPATFLLDNAEYKDKLPPLHTVEIKCVMPDRGPYEKMKKDMVLNLNGEEITALTAATLSGKLAQMASGFLYNTINVPGENRMVTDTRPMWISSHKFDRLDELLQENQRANTIIVYNFKEELAELKRRYPNAVGMDDKNAVEKWNAGKVEILCLHPKSAGHGLNLQHGGSKMVYLSLPWSLELYEQCVGRIHRSGQQKSVWVYILLTEKTIDERIWKALHNKRSISDLAMEELR
jgi:SNF2 family DNA or RNA helicase